MDRTPTQNPAPRTSRIWLWVLMPLPLLALIGWSAYQHEQKKGFHAQLDRLCPKECQDQRMAERKAKGRAKMSPQQRAGVDKYEQQKRDEASGTSTAARPADVAR